ncbi:chemokine CCL-CUj precursor [Danio rerio]|uniref:Chemokine CCL-CUj n=1 Tax=Danio rerio TaxID=7955 RepID=A9ZPG5_DANRE|nr:chemokine CCL-CUj precursor [Danio rerio]BAF98273.1 chemokine CCL-CUj [Danio rerio]|eukprot:NP_001135739.1 chemokine CCL-CUj precursor [Danio rerio]
MRIPVFLLFLVFTMCSIQLVPAYPVKETCCFNFIDFPIPANKIMFVARTSSRCAVKGIVVSTPRTQFCVKPDEDWIKPIMEKQYKR